MFEGTSRMGAEANVAHTPGENGGNNACNGNQQYMATYFIVSLIKNIFFLNLHLFSDF